MDKEEIIRRLKNISIHAVHVVGEPPFIMSLDDGIALDEAVRLLKKQEPKKVMWRVGRAHCPSCGLLFPKKKENQYIRFCSFCGQAVTWE